MIVGNKQVPLKPGQFIFGRKKASKDLKMSERSIRTCLDNLKTMGNLTIKPTNKYSIITIVNWGSYQSTETIPTSKTTNGRPATDQQPTTNKNKEIRDKAIVVIDYLNEKVNKKFKHGDKNLNFIIARFNDGFSIDDCKYVVDVKSGQWKDTENDLYLRPETLFGNKFDGYLNEKKIIIKDKKDALYAAQGVSND